MNIYFEDETDSELVGKYSELIYKVVNKTLTFEMVDISLIKKIEISYLFVNNDEIKSINKKYRAINKPTDVLSFPLLDSNITDLSSEELIPFEKEKIICLGDIVLSYEKCITQAEYFGHSLEREISFLSAHSILHLLGYDHCTKEEATIMEQKQKQIMLELNILR